MQTGKQAWKKYSADIYVQKDIKISKALHGLIEQVRHALQRYEVLCRVHGAEPDRHRVDLTRTWVEDEGQVILSSLKRKMQVADEALRGDMIRSVNAAVASGQMAEERDMSVALHREMLWEWADQIILSLQAAFRPFAEGPTLDRFIEMGELREPSPTGRTPMWSVETNESETKHYVDTTSGGTLKTSGGGTHAA